ncbi:MAG: HAMP domain-containing sensor histidine kinase [bacterium]|nr:HAMP domain-containing sensor histidine kinase [bacterium]
MQQQDHWMQILSTIVHDLKAPLSSAKTLIDGIGEVGELNEKQRHFSERARAKLLQLTGMINSILEIAWMDADAPLQLTEIDLTLLIRHHLNTFQEAAAQRHIELRSTIPERLPFIEGDERLIHQILHNLFGNAVKYNCDEGYVQVTVIDHGDQVQISVEDCGKGITPEDRAHVFERFYRSKGTAKIEGTGLGLAIVKAAVERHHGSIWFESEVDQGTTFTFVLPRRQDQQAEPPEFATREIRRAVPLGEGLNYAAGEDSGAERLDAVDDRIQESHDSGDETADARAEAGHRLNNFPD